jgi:signal transduction histidine kinase
MGERLDLAREMHERVMQRLFGVSLALSAGELLSTEEQERCRVEMVEALADLRRALERPLAPLPRETGTTLATELERLAGAPGPPVRVSWPAGLVVPPDLEPLAQSVLAEALRNVHKHARASSVDVTLARDEDTFTLEVRNDGLRETVAGRAPGAGGMGLRLAGFEALQVGGMVEFGPAGDGVWRMRLVVPVEPAP